MLSGTSLVGFTTGSLDGPIGALIFVFNQDNDGPPD
jgi:hypothetical protein